MSGSISHMVLRRSAVERDWKLGEPTVRNNGRKVMVTGLWPAAEQPIAEPEWSAGPKGGHTPVLESAPGGMEVATFTEDSAQDRHMHRISTEIYTVLQGQLRIFIGDAEAVELEAGDEIVILPGVVHQIVRDTPDRSEPRPDGEPYRLLVRMHAFQCHGSRINMFSWSRVVAGVAGGTCRRKSAGGLTRDEGDTRP